MKYKTVLFDLDGTLTDPKEGITRAFQYALQQYGIFEDDLEKFKGIIGPPLKDSFMEMYDFSEAQATEAIDHFRVYFREKGIFENEAYQGVGDMLKLLKNNGMTLAISTSKPTVFAEQVLRYFELNDYFDVIVGSFLDGTRSDKAEVIKHTLDELQLQDEKIVMIGDRKHDIIGATKNNIDSIGVTYGYGGHEELFEANATHIVDGIHDLKKLLTE